MLYTDTQVLLPDIFLEKVDRATMAHGVEARVPFLDNDLVDYALSLPAEIKMPGGAPKGLLKRALRSIVPDEVLDAKKAGFGVPYGHWLRTSLSRYMKEVLFDDAVMGSGLFDKGRMEILVSEHIRGKADNGFILWKALNLALWYSMYIKRC